MRNPPTTPLLLLGLLALGPALAGPPELPGLAAHQQGDYVAAWAELLPLAELGVAEAQFHVAGMYSRGEGVAADPTAAAHWYRQAAENGHAAAQLRLGSLYLEGRGVAPCRARAHMWTQLAEASGLPEARAQREQIEGGLEPLQLESSRMLAAEWRQAARDRAETVDGIPQVLGRHDPAPGFRQPKLIRETRVEPAYPAAKWRRTRVVLRGTISRTGEVSDLRVVRADPGQAAFARAAVAAVGQWRYQPATFWDGPIAFPLTAVVDFELAR